jgi:hypothetical protein
MSQGAGAGEKMSRHIGRFDTQDRPRIDRQPEKTARTASSSGERVRRVAGERVADRIPRNAGARIDDDPERGAFRMRTQESNTFSAAKFDQNVLFRARSRSSIVAGIPRSTRLVTPCPAMPHGTIPS